MKEKNFILRKTILTLLVTFFLFLQPLSIFSKDASKNLPPKYKKWLNEEVVYIITPIEKEIFLKLKTDRERDLFIKAFWKHRDPTPGTERNEFKEEHYRRIKYANRWFGHDSPTPGSKTDRGRIYILLGKPNSVDKIESDSELNPTIIWFYQGKSNLGLPNAFNVVFFKKYGMGEYKLYSPIKDGPQSLLKDFRGDPTDYLSAYRKIMDIEPSVAKVSLSLIPNETKDFYSPSISSEILIKAKIPEIPKKIVNSEYAKNFLKFKGVVETDYSLNYISNKNIVKVIKEKNNVFFINYLIKPERLSVESYGYYYKTKFQIIGNLFSKDNKQIYHFEKIIPLEISQNDYEKVKHKNFAIQDLIPVTPGEYNLTVLLKNTASKEFTSFDKNIIIQPKTRISDLIVANRKKEETESSKKIFPFTLNNTKFRLSPENAFTNGDKLYLSFYLYDIEENYTVKILIKDKNGKIFKKKDKKLVKPAKIVPVNEEFNLSNLPATFYIVEVSLFKQNKLLEKKQDNFYISPLLNLKKSWVLSIPILNKKSELLKILGEQYQNKGDIKKAEEYLQKAFEINKNNPDIAVEYGKLLLKLGKNNEILKITEGFLNTSYRKSFLLLAAFAYHNLKQYEKAVSFYEEFLNKIGKTPQILNLTAECYIYLNKPDKAKKYYKESLSLNPEQKKIKEILTILNGRGK